MPFANRPPREDEWNLASALAILTEFAGSGAPARLLWWQAAPGFLHVVGNEGRLACFQRFGRGSFDPRSKP
jgi:hypothetical protein